MAVLLNRVNLRDGVLVGCPQFGDVVLRGTSQLVHGAEVIHSPGMCSFND